MRKTVKQFIKELQKYHPDTLIVTLYDQSNSDNYLYVSPKIREGYTEENLHIGNYGGKEYIITSDDSFIVIDQ